MSNYEELRKGTFIEFKKIIRKTPYGWESMMILLDKSEDFEDKDYGEEYSDALYDEYHIETADTAKVGEVFV